MLHIKYELTQAKGVVGSQRSLMELIKGNRRVERSTEAIPNWRTSFDNSTYSRNSIFTINMMKERVRGTRDKGERKKDTQDHNSLPFAVSTPAVPLWFP